MVLRAGLQAGLLNQSSAQVIDGSLTINGSNQYLTRTHTASNTRTWTFSCWVKKQRNAAYHQLFTGFNTGANQSGIIFMNDDTLRIYSQGGLTMEVITSAVYRDPGWMNVVAAIDTTISSPSSDRVKLWVNGTRVTSLGTATYPSENDETYINTNITHYVGSNQPSSNTFYGQYAQAYFIDSQALDASYFGFTDPLTNTWRPKKVDLSEITSGRVFVENTHTGGSVGSGVYNASLTGTRTAGSYSGDTFTATNAGWVITFDLNEYDSFTLSDVTSSGESDETWYYSNDSTFASGVTGPNSGTIADGTWSTTVSGTKYRYLRLQNVPSITYSVVGNITNPQNAWGANGFYLPMDGNSPIGQDKSGKGNNWTPKNFGGSVALDKATGALPILNTLGGTVARPGVFGSEVSKYYTVTTADGSVYQFDITSGDNPSLSFIRGATYKFDYSSFTGHPVLFSSTNPDSSTTAYTDGTSIASNVISFTVPHDAPDTLYYYCQNHPTSMNGSISVTTDETKADPYAWKNVLALPLIGSAADVSASIACTSTTKTLTTNGNAAASSAQSNFYGGSYYFDGTGDYLSVSSTSDFAFGTGDFTLEYWINTSDTDFNLMHPDSSTGSGYWGHLIQTSSFNWNNAYNSSNLWNVSASPILDGEWHHCAICRSSGTTKVFFDGVSQPNTSGSFTDNTDYNGVDGWEIGGSGNLNDLTGYIQDLRVYKGVAKYTSNFIPASTNPDILPDTPSGVSGSSKLTKITDGAVSFDGTGDYMESSTSADYQFGTGDFTVECFVYLKKDNANQVMVGNWGSNDGWQLYFTNTGDKFAWYRDGAILISSNTVIKANRWYHVAAARSGSTTKLFVDGILEGSASDSNDYAQSKPLEIGRQQSTNTNLLDGFISNIRVVKGSALYTSNFTPPTRTLTNVTNTKLLCCQSNTQAGGAAVAPNVSGINNGTQWSHYLTGAGGFQSSYPATNAFNGTISASETSRSTNNGETQTFAPPVGIPYSSKVEVWTWYTGNVSLNGGSNVAVSDDQDWRTIATGSGTLNSLAFIGDSNNSIYLAGIRIDSTTILLDPIAPIGNAAATNFNPFNTDINTVRGQETGYCTWNPLKKGTTTTLSNGNLSMSSSNSWESVFGTIGVSSGKWYWESNPSSDQYMYSGIANESHPTSYYPSQGANSWAYLTSDGQAWYNQLPGTSVQLSTMGSGDTLGIAFDADNGRIWFSKNGVWMQGNPSTGTNAVFTNITTGVSYFPCQDVYGASATTNFGQKPFKYAPPEGFQPLNAANVRPSTVIARPDQYVGVSTWTGDNTENRLIPLNMKPDLIWIKQRNDTRVHILQDSVRGFTKGLYSNGTDTESTRDPGYGEAVPGGFEVSSGAGSNVSGRTMVAWTWKAGGNKNTFNVDDVGYASAAAAGLDGGTATVTGASVGTKQGFSIIKYTTTTNAGDFTVSHGLSEAPTFIITRKIASGNWVTGHHSIGWAKYLFLNSNVAVATNSNAWGNISPTSSVFGGNDTGFYGNGVEQISYIWHDVPGLQKFGSYTYTGSRPFFVELGFKPAILWLKRTGSGSATNISYGSWFVADKERGKFNPVSYTESQWLNRAKASGQRGDSGTSAAGTYLDIDLVSNGFVIPTTGGGAEFNQPSDVVVYCAWAEAPASNLFGGQSTGR